MLILKTCNFHHIWHQILGKSQNFECIICIITSKVIGKKTSLEVENVPRPYRVKSPKSLFKFSSFSPALRLHHFSIHSHMKVILTLQLMIFFVKNLHDFSRLSNTTKCNLPKPPRSGDFIYIGIARRLQSP